jgi:hypothetical protein
VRFCGQHKPSLTAQGIAIVRALESGRPAESRPGYAPCARQCAGGCVIVSAVVAKGRECEEQGYSAGYIFRGVEKD